MQPSLVRSLRELPRWVYAAIAAYWLSTILAEAAAWRLDPQFREIAFSWTHFYVKRGALSLYWMGASVLALAWYAERPVTGERLGRSIALTGVVALAIAAGYAVWTGVVLWFVTGYTGRELVTLLWSGDLVYAYLTAWQIIFAANAWHYFRQLAKKRRESDQLRLRLAQTELMLFRAQLEPHFLFNALNSIASLVRLRRHEAAVEALSRLSALLRSILEIGERHLMPWHWERGFAHLYIELQQLRFAEQLEVRIEDTDVAPETPIPILLLQPLLENAIHHGPLADGERCEVMVRLRATGVRVQLEVSNAVAHSAGSGNAGVGLANVEARLRALYGRDYSFSHAQEHGNFTVRADFPLQPAA